MMDVEEGKEGNLAWLCGLGLKNSLVSISFTTMDKMEEGHTFVEMR